MKQSGGLEITGYDDFAGKMDRLANDPQYLKEEGQKAGQFVKGQAGATSKVLSSVKSLCS